MLATPFKYQDRLNNISLQFIVYLNVYFFILHLGLFVQPVLREKWHMTRCSLFGLLPLMTSQHLPEVVHENEEVITTYVLKFLINE